MREGTREWMVPSFAYYAWRKHGQLQTTTNHYAATAMTLNLAEQKLAKTNSTGMEHRRALVRCLSGVCFSYGQQI